jgi:hypothetical protein|tara:strand:+ start:9505 stop:10044 length:540 start_codon:yes stop_codon:yes gene_type:complete
MVKGRDYDSVSETGNWNVASDYSKLKIMKPLYMADEYETIATFGSSSLFEELQINYNTDFLRIKALKRLLHVLIMLINNSRFAIKNKTDKDKLKEFKKTLDRIGKIIPTLYKNRTDNIKKTKELIIDVKKYDPILNIIVDIKAEINEYLNKHDLLFTDKEEFDPQQAKKDYFKNLTTRG